MEPLRPADPSRLGRYRLLGRLGAGGMGVVFLARSPGGAVAAVKVIRTVYAEDEAFRTRFRREVAAARGVRGPWVVPLLDADPGAETPWLATAFVPGPSLAEALETLGPLPYATVRILGARLAEALGAVHRAGLVHRDVKPGNVLLAPDGPRLIDFGIARASDGTALTSSGVIIGSPGFLSPEQAQARGPGVGPPSDVFSLGCVLAFAAGGVRPFGDGASPGMLVRTVYEEPDLEGVPPELEPLVRACLAKRPAARPSVAELGEALGGALPGSQPDDPLGRGVQVRDAVVGGGADWLPEPVIRLIADRSAAVLAFGAIEETQVSAGSGVAADAGVPAGVTGDGVPLVGRPDRAAPDGPAPDVPTVTDVRKPTVGLDAPGRRLLLLGAAASVLGAGGAAWWWVTRGAGGNPRDTVRSRPELGVAFHGDLSGAQRELGRAEWNGTQLAVERVNAQPERPFRLAVQPYDDAGDPAEAAAVAKRLAADSRVLAVFGPTTDACFAAVEKAYAQASVPLISVSVESGVESGVANGISGFRSHAATRAKESLLAAPCVAYLKHAARARRTLLVDDQEAGAPSWDLCDQVRRATRRDGGTATVRTVAAGTVDFGGVAAGVLAADADAVVFGGGAQRAASLARALASAGFSGARIATQRAFGSGFLEAAGAAAEGWVFATCFIDPTAEPATRDFAAAYRQRFGTVPGRYAAEAYDAVMFLAETLAGGGTAPLVRSSIARRMQETEFQGITRKLAYRPDMGYTMNALFLFRVERGAFRYLGQYETAAARRPPGGGG